MSWSRVKRMLRLPPERSYGWIAPRSGGYSGLDVRDARPEIPTGPVPPPPTADDEELHDEGPPEQVGSPRRRSA